MPEGFKRLPWANAVKGQQVWLNGMSGDSPKAYGPHTVHSPQHKELASGSTDPRYNGRVFRHYAEDLLVAN